MQSFFNAVLYATTPEMFPAYVRGSACGLASTLGRLSGVSFRPRRVFLLLIRGICFIDRRSLRCSKIRRQRVCRRALARHWRHLARHARPRLSADRNQESTGFLRSADVELRADGADALLYSCLVVIIHVCTSDCQAGVKVEVECKLYQGIFTINAFLCCLASTAFPPSPFCITLAGSQKANFPDARNGEMHRKRCLSIISWSNLSLIQADPTNDTFPKHSRRQRHPEYLDVSR